MLMRLIKQIFTGNKNNVGSDPQASGAPGKGKYYNHFKIIFDDIRVSDFDFLDLYKTCLTQTHTPILDKKWQIRAQRALHLAQYFHAALDLDGNIAECGVFQGFSALLMCKIAHASNPDFLGERMHLVDSCEGLSEPTDEDKKQVDGKQYDYDTFKGTFAYPAESVRNSLSAFPEVSIHKGWIPEVLKELPETTWSFVHLDVDLYQPTLDGLEYFYPRMVPGGIIINDDYSQTLFPGCGEAWRKYCDDQGLEFTELTSGQALLIKR